MTQLWKEEFPDFGDMPEIPAAWTDTSWRNDACPSFVFGAYMVWVDYADEGKRDVQGLPRFVVCTADGDGAPVQEVCATDDWQTVLGYLGG